MTGNASATQCSLPDKAPAKRCSYSLKLSCIHTSLQRSSGSTLAIRMCPLRARYASIHTYVHTCIHTVGPEKEVRPKRRFGPETLKIENYFILKMEQFEQIINSCFLIENWKLDFKWLSVGKSEFFFVSFNIGN